MKCYIYYIELQSEPNVGIFIDGAYDELPKPSKKNECPGEKNAIAFKK